MTVQYKDTWLKIVGSFIIAHFIEMIGQEETTWELLLHPAYYIEVGSGLIIALCVWEFISRATKWLDKKYDWVVKPVYRSMFQLGVVVVLASLLTYLLVNLQFRFIFQKNILDGNWLLYEFPVAVVFIVMINIFYIGYYFFERWRYNESLLQSQLQSGRAIIKEPLISVKDDRQNLQQDVILARKGAKVFPLEVKEVAFVYKDSSFNYIKTFSEEVFVIDRSLEEIEKNLNAVDFFRANRQTIINLKSIQSYMPIENGKLKVILKFQTPSLIVSQKRAPDFRMWMKGNRM